MISLSTISRAILANAFAAGLLAAPSLAQEVTTDIGTLDKDAVEKAFPAKPPYSPYAGRNFPTRPFFGDTHTHTSFSMDAGAFGAGSARGTPIASPRAKRSWRRADSAPSCRGRSISWWSPTTPTAWAFSRN